MNLSIKGGFIFDGVNEDLQRNKMLNIEKGFIKALDSVNNETKILDADNCYIMPGLIDTHVHLIWDARSDPETFIANKPDSFISLMAAKQMMKYLPLGITTLRDTGSQGSTVLSLRNLINMGLYSGTDLIVSGPPIAMTGGHIHRFAIEADGEAEVLKASRKLLKMGVDFIKVMATGGVYTDGEEPGSPQLNLEEIQICVQEAKKAGKKVSAHAQGLAGIKNSIKAGVSTIEHGYYADEECLQQMKAKGIFLIPVIVCPWRMTGQEALKAGVPPFAVRKAQEIVKAQEKSFKMAVEIGVPIATGTDTGAPRTPPEDYFLEIKRMQQGGMSIFEVLKACTSQAAKAITRSDLGIIEENMKGDLLILEKNPLDDLDNLKSIRYVIKQGTLVYQGANN